MSHVLDTLEGRELAREDPLGFGRLRTDTGRYESLIQEILDELDQEETAKENFRFLMATGLGR